MALDVLCSLWKVRIGPPSGLEIRAPPRLQPPGGRWERAVDTDRLHPTFAQNGLVGRIWPPFPVGLCQTARLPWGAFQAFSLLSASHFQLLDQGQDPSLPPSAPSLGVCFHSSLGCQGEPSPILVKASPAMPAQTHPDIMPHALS